MHTFLSRKLRLATAALALLLLLSGCGSKGALYLPDSEAEIAKTDASRGR